MLKRINIELYVLHVIPGVSELKPRAASPDKTIKYNEFKIPLFFLWITALYFSRLIGNI